MFSTEFRARTDSDDVIADRRAGDLLTGRRLRAQQAVVGVDGGGTKTHAVIMDVNQRILGEGVAGPSNPLRVGIASAAGAVREAIDRACASAKLRRTDLVAAQVGLAGARREELRARMREALSDIGIGEVEVVGDAEIALYGATDGEAGLVVIAGTGSICYGINARGKQAFAGGWGPVAGDEGSGAWMSRCALHALAKAADGRGPATALTDAASTYFHVTAPEDLSTAIYAPTMTNERLAGFGKHVIEAAMDHDDVAEKIVTQAGIELGLAAIAVIRALRMERERFHVAYVGGVFAAAKELVLGPMSDEVKTVAPRAFLAPPRFSPAVAAAKMARMHINEMPLAG